MANAEMLPVVRKFISEDPIKRFNPTDVCLDIKGIDALAYGQILHGFVVGVERFDQLLGFPQAQFQKETYPAMQALREQLGTQVIPTLDQLVAGYEGRNSDATVQNMLRIAEVIVDMIVDPEFRTVPVEDKNFSFGLRLFDGYINSVGYTFGNEEITGHVRLAFEEVLLTDYPKSLLTKQVETRHREMQERLERQLAFVAECAKDERVATSFKLKEQPKEYVSIENALEILMQGEETHEELLEMITVLFKKTDMNKWLSLYLRKIASEDEQRFGADFFFQHRHILAAFVQQARGDRNKEDIVVRIGIAINSAEPDAAAWWSYAPHIYTRLLKRGVKTERAMEHVILWGQDAKRSEKNEMHLEGALSMLASDEIDAIVMQLVINDKFHPDKAFLQ